MAFPLSVPNSFVDAATIEADEHNANFTAVVNAANTELVWADDSVPFTATPTGPAADPTTDNQLSRKAYVDKKAGRFVERNEWYGGAGLLTVGSGVNMGVWKGLNASLTITQTVTEDHWYRVTFTVPELTTNKQAALGVAPRIAAAILVDDENGATLQRVVSEHNTEDQGQFMHVEYTFQAATTEELTFFPAVSCLEFGADATATIKVRVAAGYPAVHTLEDLGI